MVAAAVWIEDAAHGWLPATAAEGRNESTVGITVAKTACKKRLSAVDVTSVPTKAVLARALGDLQATVADMTQLTDVSEVCTAEARTASTHATHTAAASPGALTALPQPPTCKRTRRRCKRPALPGMR
jgi:hypothetical protein